MSDKEISVTSDGVVLKGDVVDAVSTPISTICKTADNILQLVDNVVGLPTDFLNFHLKTFRESYKEGYEKIPKQRRIEPTLRLGCNVLRNVAYAAEEPEIQKLFATRPSQWLRPPRASDPMDVAKTLARFHLMCS